MIMARWRFQIPCKSNGCAFVARGSTRRTCQTTLARHVREQHNKNSSARRKRRNQQAQRIKLIRRQQPLLLQGKADTHRFIITAPRHRSSMWETCKNNLVAKGIPAKHVKRRLGIDFKSYSTGKQFTKRLPEGLKKHTFLMWDFHKSFLPACRDRFHRDHSVDIIWWVEDDCQLKKTINAESMESFALAGKGCLHWAGYIVIKGKAWWGSHLVGVSRSGVEHAIAKLDEEAKAAKGSGDRLGYLMGLDTWLRKQIGIERGGQPLVRIWPSSVAHQRKHEFQWRY